MQLYQTGKPVKNIDIIYNHLNLTRWGKLSKNQDTWLDGCLLAYLLYSTLSSAYEQVKGYEP